MDEIHDKRVNLGYSTKNIPLHSRRIFMKHLIPKVQSLINRMRWKVFIANKQVQAPTSEDATCTTAANYGKFGLKSLRTAPQEDPELTRFESRLYNLISNIEFEERPKLNPLTRKLNDDIKRLKRSNSVWIKGDKTTNYYEVDVETHNELLHRSVTAQYRKCDESEEKKINSGALDIVKELYIEDRTHCFSKEPAFITLKDHKSDFSTKPSVRLINPAKTDIGKVAKKMLDRIINEVRSSECTGDNKLIQCRNTAEVLKWFKTLS